MNGDRSFIVLGEEPLIPELPPPPSFAQRIQRAHDLSGRHPSAAEILGFYARLAFHQQHVFDSLNHGRRDRFDADPANGWPLLPEITVPVFPDFARSLAEISPEPMRERAVYFAASNAGEQTELLEHFWNTGFAQDSPRLSAADRFIALAFLQPYAEWLVKSGHSTSAAMHHATCPVCSSEPICAVLRDQDHGARRSLVCSLCMHEWNFLRVVCPACGEERFDSLPVFTPQEVPQLRIDACDTCRHYIKTVDMTKDGLAVPIVDELASVSLDLWAADRGYRKLTRNLAGI